ncbi:MAG: hypothetical protein JWM16_3672 [Verrucomicrobiales bacterium]|nr:hypothetical protein [Verrucomicrobiales bacterium]
MPRLATRWMDAGNLDHRMKLRTKMCLAFLGFVLAVLVWDGFSLEAGRQTFPVCFLDGVSGQPITNGVVFFSESTEYPVLRAIQRLPSFLRGRDRVVLLDLTRDKLRFPRRMLNNNVSFDFGCTGYGVRRYTINPQERGPHSVGGIGEAVYVNTNESNPLVQIRVLPENFITNRYE